MAVGVLVHVNSTATIVARTSTLGDLKDELLKFNSHPAPGSLSLSILFPHLFLSAYLFVSLRFSLSVSLYVSISLYSYQSIFRTYYTATLITEVEGE